MNRGASILVLLLVGVATPLAAQVMEVTLKLPVRARLSIGPDEHLAIAPFVIVSTAEDKPDNRAAKVDVQAEFQRYLGKQLSKELKSPVTILHDVRLPGTDMKTLGSDQGFWRDLGRRNGSDYIVSGVIDFDVEGKVGYRTEEYVSPVDGRTYYRQVLVESTGFVFDIVIAVFDGETGEKLVEENFRDFKEFQQQDYDELLGLFENLRSLESRLLSLFVAQETTATRYLFTP